MRDEIEKNNEKRSRDGWASYPGSLYTKNVTNLHNFYTK